MAVLQRPAIRGAPSAMAPPLAGLQPWDTLLWSAAALILVSVARLHSFIPGLDAIRPGMILTVISVVALSNGQKGARKIELLKSPLGLVMGLLVIWPIIMIPMAIYPGRSFAFVYDKYLREAIVVLAVSASVRDVGDLNRLLKIYGYGVIVFAFMAAGGGARNVGGGGYDANDSAMLIVSGIPIILYFLVRAQSLATKGFFGFGLVAAASSVVMSDSRGGFLALIAVMIYSLFFLKGIKKSLRLGVVVAASAVVFLNADAAFWERMRSMNDPDDYNVTSYTGRQQIWERGMDYMMQKPITGVGIDNFVVAEGWNPVAQAMIASGRGVKFSAPHSIWVQIGAELGLVGFLGLAALFLMSGKVLWTVDSSVRGARGKPVPGLSELAELSRPLIGVLVGAAVAGSFLSKAYSSLLWLPFALALSIDKLSRMMKSGQLAAVPTNGARMAPSRPRLPSVRLPGTVMGTRPQSGGA